MGTYSNILAWEIPRTDKTGGPWVQKESGKIKPAPQKSCFPQLPMVQTAYSLTSKLVEEKLQREKNFKNPQEVKTEK